jgi:SlyX protein
METRLDAAEIHISHITRSVEELSDLVAKQADQIDRLNARFQMLVDRLSKQNSGEDSDVPLLDQRPPHW